VVCVIEWRAALDELYVTNLVSYHAFQAFISQFSKNGLCLLESGFYLSKGAVTPLNVSDGNESGAKSAPRQSLLSKMFV